ncbi:MAG TPA: glycosyltransferase family A protein [Gemmatimonadaceae bacterium]|nr:glycosyltransferase family A protein [Gemmatimonadaceae bacterium]
MTPRVSVVMPVYNGERFLADAVNSVLASDFADFELLVLVDGGSTDGSAAEAARLAAADPRVRVVEHPHAAPSIARNVGLHEARGELVANLDSDDAMLPERLGRQVDYLDRHPECVGVGSRALIVDSHDQPVRIGVRTYTHEAIDAAHLDGRGGTIMNPTATFRREAALAIGGYSADLLTTGEDHDFWLRLAEVGRLVNLPDVLTRYRIHDRNASIGGTNSERRRAVTLEILSRAFARRGITGREPTKHKAPPARAWETWCDRALMGYFTGNRRKALVAALVAVALRPGAPSARWALGAVLRGPSRWLPPASPA